MHARTRELPRGARQARALRAKVRAHAYVIVSCITRSKVVAGRIIICPCMRTHGKIRLARLAGTCSFVWLTCLVEVGEFRLPHTTPM